MQIGTAFPRNAQGYTLIDLLAVQFVVVVATLGFVFAKARYGTWVGIVASVIGFAVSIVLVFEFYKWSGRQGRKQLEAMAKKYPSVYRVLALTDERRKSVIAEGAEIRAGDFGWEAGPIGKEDGLIYLQGLTKDWRVVWHAAFRPEEIERVAQKPESQYDHWVPDWAKSTPAPTCPFPIMERDTPNIGLPHRSHHYFTTTPLKREGAK